MGRTTKPCPGCKGNHPSRKADSVCHECAQLLRDGRQLRKERLAVVADGENCLVVIPQADHWMPYVYGDKGQPVMAGFRALGMAVGQPIRVEELVVNEAGVRDWEARGPWPPGAADALQLVGERNPSTYSSSCDYYTVKKAQHTVIVALWNSIKEWGEAMMLRGRQQGSNLLAGLATGEYSVADFNKHTMEEREHRR